MQRPCVARQAGSFFLAAAASHQVLMNLVLVALLSVLLRKLLSPGTRSSMMTGNGLLPNRCSRPPTPLPSHDTQREQSKWSQFTAGCRSYCVKLGIKVKTAEGESGRLGAGELELRGAPVACVRAGMQGDGRAA